MSSSQNRIEVTVLFFARAHELAGTTRESLSLPASATVAEAEQVLRERYPLLAKLLDSSRIAVDEEFADPGQKLRNGAVLAVIPPVSGG